MLSHALGVQRHKRGALCDSGRAIAGGSVSLELQTGKEVLSGNGALFDFERKEGGKKGAGVACVWRWAGLHAACRRSPGIDGNEA